MIGHRPPDWTEKAACDGLVTASRDVWSPGDHLTPEEKAQEWHYARTICSRCPVRLECAVDALKDLPRAEEHSMRGGLTPDELTDLAKAMGMKWRREAQHGTRSRYVAGPCLPNGERCEDCRNAHRIYEHERRLHATPRGRRITRTDVYAHLTRPLGRGRHQAGVGQLLLFTDGLPARTHSTEGTEAA